MEEKFKKFIEAAGISEDYFKEDSELDPADAVKEFSSRVAQSVKNDADFLAEIQKQNFGKFNGSTINKLKKQFGFTESDVKEKTLEEVLAMGTEKLRQDAGKGQEELLQKLQKLPTLEEENNELKSRLEALPVEIERQFVKKQRINTAVLEAYASVKNIPIPAEDFALIAQNKILQGEFIFDESGAMLKKNGEGYEIDKQTYKPIDYREKLKALAASYIPKQNDTPPASTPITKPPTGTGNAPGMNAVLERLGGFVPPHRK